MTCYAHTANGPDGKPLPETSGYWQLLSVHLRNVADLAKRFAEPLLLDKEAELAGLLHDLGKYAERFQARLKDPSIHGINHWAAGTGYTAQTLKQFSAAFAVDGHHTGIPALEGAVGLRQTVERLKADQNRRELTGCTESLAELLGRFKADGLHLPALASRQIDYRFAEALRTRLLFSCLVDADFRDTENHFDPGAAILRDVPQLQPVRSLEILRRHLTRAKRRSMHSSSSSFISARRGNHPLGGGFEESDHPLPFHRGEALQEIINRIPRFKVVEQRLHRNTRAGETRCAAHHVRVGRDDFPFHAFIIGQPALNSS